MGVPGGGAVLAPEAEEESLLLRAIRSDSHFRTYYRRNMKIKNNLQYIIYNLVNVTNISGTDKLGIL